MKNENCYNCTYYEHEPDDFLSGYCFLNKNGNDIMTEAFKMSEHGECFGISYRFLYEDEEFQDMTFHEAVSAFKRKYMGMEDVL